MSELLRNIRPKVGVCKTPTLLLLTTAIRKMAFLLWFRFICSVCYDQMLFCVAIFTLCTLGTISSRLHIEIFFLFFSTTGFDISCKLTPFIYSEMSYSNFSKRLHLIGMLHI